MKGKTFHTLTNKRENIGMDNGPILQLGLIKKGIDEKYINDSISKIISNDPDSDFFSAIKICKKRRIGPIREENNRPLFYKKDISILARSGFSYEISKKVLELSKIEFQKFCKML